MFKKKAKKELRFDYEDRARNGFIIVTIGVLLGLLLFVVVVYKLYETSLIGPQYRLGVEETEVEEDTEEKTEEQESGQASIVEFDMGKLVAGEAKAWQETVYWREVTVE